MRLERQMMMPAASQGSGLARSGGPQATTRSVASREMFGGTPGSSSIRTLLTADLSGRRRHSACACRPRRASQRLRTM